MHKQLLYVVKKTKILNRENHNNEVYTRTHHFKIYTSNRQSMIMKIYCQFYNFEWNALSTCTISNHSNIIWAVDNFPDPAACQFCSTECRI